jgi:hypothetical protein
MPNKGPSLQSSIQMEPKGKRFSLNTQIFVYMRISEIGIATILSTPGLIQQEMAFVKRCKSEHILESFFISVSKRNGCFYFRKWLKTAS